MFAEYHRPSKQNMQEKYRVNQTCITFQGLRIHQRPVENIQLLTPLMALLCSGGGTRAAGAGERGPAWTQWQRPQICRRDKTDVNIIPGVVCAIAVPFLSTFAVWPCV